MRSWDLFGSWAFADLGVDIVQPMKFPYEEFDLTGVRTYPLATRKSKANAADFARAYQRGSGVAGLIGSLPNILAAADFKAVVDAIAAARAGERGIVWGLGAHVHQDRALADPHRSDGARVRLRDRDQWRRDHPRLRAGAVGRDVRGGRRGAGAGQVRDGGGNGTPVECRDQRWGRPRARDRSGGRSHIWAPRSRRTPRSASSRPRRVSTFR